MLYTLEKPKPLIDFFFFCAIGCKSESTKLEMRCEGPPLPETIGRPTGKVLCILVSV